MAAPRSSSRFVTCTHCRTALTTGSAGGFRTYASPAAALSGSANHSSVKARSFENPEPPSSQSARQPSRSTAHYLTDALRQVTLGGPGRYLRPLYCDDGQVKEDPPLPTPVILGIDDLRPLPRATRVARTNGEGIQLLQEHRDRFIDELWLDHDLGGDDSILPVVTLMEEAAFNGRPFRIGTVFVHSANPIGAETVVRSLTRWNYQVRRATP